jgi:hypothetical protein
LSAETLPHPDTGDLPLVLGRFKANGCEVDLSGNDGFVLSTDITDVAYDTVLDFTNCQLEGLFHLY